MEQRTDAETRGFLGLGVLLLTLLTVAPASLIGIGLLAGVSRAFTGLLALSMGLSAFGSIGLVLLLPSVLWPRARLLLRVAGGVGLFFVLTVGWATLGTLASPLGFALFLYPGTILVTTYVSYRMLYLLPTRDGLPSRILKSDRSARVWQTTIFWLFLAYGLAGPISVLIAPSRTVVGVGTLVLFPLALAYSLYGLQGDITESAPSANARSLASGALLITAAAFPRIYLLRLWWSPLPREYLASALGEDLVIGHLAYDAHSQLMNWLNIGGAIATLAAIGLFFATHRSSRSYSEARVGRDLQLMLLAGVIIAPMLMGGGILLLDDDTSVQVGQSLDEEGELRKDGFKVRLFGEAMGPDARLIIALPNGVGIANLSIDDGDSQQVLHNASIVEHELGSPIPGDLDLEAWLGADFAVYRVGQESTVQSLQSSRSALLIELNSTVETAAAMVFDGAELRDVSLLNLEEVTGTYAGPLIACCFLCLGPGAIGLTGFAAWQDRNQRVAVVVSQNQESGHPVVEESPRQWLDSSGWTWRQNSDGRPPEFWDGESGRTPTHDPQGTSVAPAGSPPVG